MSEDSGGPSAGPAPRLPRVNPVGVVEYPADYEGTPRRISPGMRLGVILVLVVFLATAVVTTVASLGAYCLTTDGGNLKGLPWAGAAPDG